MKPFVSNFCHLIGYISTLSPHILPVSLNIAAGFVFPPEYPFKKQPVFAILFENFVKLQVQKKEPHLLHENMAHSIHENYLLKFW